MKTRMIEVNVEFVIAALESRYDDVKGKWGCQASHDLWEQALSLVEDCGLGNCSSPSVYVDNYLINGEFVNRNDLSDCESRSITITCCDDEGDFISDEDWSKFCEDNALIYNDEYACLQF